MKSTAVEKTKKQTGDRFECGLIEILDQVLPKKQQKLYSGLP